MNALGEIVFYHNYVSHVAFTFCYNTSLDPQDVTQEVYLRIATGKTFEHRSNIKTWLYAITKNTFLILLKKETKHAHKENLFVIPSFDPREEIKLNHLIDKLYKAIKTLSKKEQEAVLLRLQDKTYSQIAEQMKVTRTNVCLLLFRAREHLRIIIKDKKGKKKWNKRKNYG